MSYHRLSLITDENVMRRFHTFGNCYEQEELIDIELRHSGEIYYFILEDVHSHMSIFIISFHVQSIAGLLHNFVCGPNHDPLFRS